MLTQAGADVLSPGPATMPVGLQYGANKSAGNEQVCQIPQRGAAPEDAQDAGLAAGFDETFPGRAQAI